MPPQDKTHIEDSFSCCIFTVRPLLTMKLFVTIVLCLLGKAALAADVEVPVNGNPASIDLLCEDTSEHGAKQCLEWALVGECEKNKAYMEMNCRKSCGLCDGGDGFKAFDCMDLADEGETQCREWAWHGECEKNTFFMQHRCAKSCGYCTPKEPSKCEDAFPTCKDWASLGHCGGFWEAPKGPYTINSAFVVEFCPVSCGVCNINLTEDDYKLGLGFPQTAPELDEGDKFMRHRIRSKVAETFRYVAGLPKEIQQVCKFGHPNCARFALGEQCEDEEYKDHYVFKYLCAAACKTCEKFADPEERAEVERHYKEMLEEAEAFYEYNKAQQERDTEIEWD